MSKAEQAFNKYDVSGDGCLQISELYMVFVQHLMLARTLISE